MAHCIDCNYEALDTCLQCASYALHDKNLKCSDLKPYVAVEQAGNRITLRFNEKGYYDKGSTQIDPSELSLTLKGPRNSYKYSVEYSIADITTDLGVVIDLDMEAPVFRDDIEVVANSSVTKRVDSEGRVQQP